MGRQYILREVNRPLRLVTAKIASNTVAGDVRSIDALCERNGKAPRRRRLEGPTVVSGAPAAVRSLSPARFDLSRGPPPPTEERRRQENEDRKRNQPHQATRAR